MMEPLEYMPVGCAAFSAVSANVLEESAVSDDVVSPDEEGVCCSCWFSQVSAVGNLHRSEAFQLKDSFSAFSTARLGRTC